jgi:two-component system chemotaxis sensor kinase CheA
VGTPRLQAIADQAPQRLQSLRTELDKVRRSFLDDWRLLDRAGAVLDERVRRIRMLPFSHGCIGLDRVVYDLAQGAGKDAELRVEGGEVAIDRSVLEELKDPLRHLIRNAVSHGIELPKERERAGKPARGCIRASAALRGGQVEIVVSDDGQGLPVEAIRRRAREIKLPEPTDDRALIEAVFIPGFSTAMDVGSAGAGRGIGLDAVRTQIKKMHGAVEVSFAPGKGTRVRLVVPLTLALLRVLLVKVGQQVFAISNHYVHKLLRVQRREVLRVGEHNMLLVDGQPVALQTLAHALSLPEPQVSDWQGKLPVVVLKSENRLAAFVVEELLAEQEVMVKGLGNRVQRLRNVAGAVLLADGRVALTLQVADLLHRHEQLSQSVAPMLQQLYADAATVKKKRCILVVDDSMTARSLARRILEAAGYLVELASDGVVGWERVQAGDIDLVLCDIDMPLMNGFQLTQTIRSSDRFRSLPVILITSTDNARSRERGAMAGANAYVTKGNFDQDMLLSLIEQLL